jgi:hypothetical protein
MVAGGEPATIAELFGSADSLYHALPVSIVLLANHGQMAVRTSILDRLVTQLRRKGMSAAMANATARRQLQRAGILKKGSDELTEYGKKRQAMGAAGRAKDRAAKESGRKPSEYKYNPRTNRATLKKKK